MVCAVLPAGCGFGPGSSSEGTATLTVTRDYGAEPMLEAGVEDPGASETVLRMLDRETEIETRYGGGFVQSIEGVAGAVDGDRRSDWFFFVNGTESSIGSADYRIEAGDRVWWDHRDWTDAMRVPAVIGSWPEPFLQASAGGSERLPVRVECAGSRVPCETAAERLADEGVSVTVERFGAAGPDEALRLLVGPWRVVGEDGAARQLDAGPGTSGVFARFDRRGASFELTALDARAEAAARLGAGGGLVAALRDGEDPPTWIVTGVDGAGVRAAAEALDSRLLERRYAVAVGAGSVSSLSLPVADEE